ncbi:hypothetical protein K443DRAFT_90266, partial [Laccaria amethystina LaAM-08-1]
DDLPGPFQDNFIRGSIFFFSQPAADLPIQPLVRLSNPKTPLPITAWTAVSRAFEGCAASASISVELSIHSF